MWRDDAEMGIDRYRLYVAHKIIHNIFPPFALPLRIRRNVDRTPDPEVLRTHNAHACSCAPARRTSTRKHNTKNTTQEQSSKAGLVGVYWWLWGCEQRLFCHRRCTYRLQRLDQVAVRSPFDQRHLWRGMAYYARATPIWRAVKAQAR